MSEGATHSYLVQELSLFVHSLGLGAECSVYIDVPGRTASSKPPMVCGYTPDLYISGRSAVIGEAKTCADLDRFHSRDQIKAFIGYLKTEANGLFVLAVPLLAWNHGKAIIRSIKADLDANDVEAICIHGDYCKYSADDLFTGRVA